ncbi:MAG: hypothetical protein V3U15_05905, partial [Nitrospinota bacterium]
MKVKNFATRIEKTDVGVFWSSLMGASYLEFRVNGKKSKIVLDPIKIESLLKDLHLGDELNSFVY